MAVKTVGIRVEAAASALAALEGVIAEQWRQPVQVSNLIGNRTIAQIDALTPALGDGYLATDAGTPAAGTSDALVVGDIAEYDGTSWKKIVAQVGGFPPAGTRALLSTATALVAPYTDGADDGKVVEFGGASLTGSDSGDATDGSALLILGGAAYASHRLFSFDGVVPTGTWADLVPPAGGSLPWESVAVKTDANNGEDLSPAALNVFALALSTADIDVFLPDAVAGSLPVGTQVFAFCGRANTFLRSIVRSQGADLILGPGTPTTQFTWQIGLYLFTYAGTSLGAPMWFVQNINGQRSEEQSVVALLGYSDSLPAFTPSGVGADQILTANANGQFQLTDGTLLSASANVYASILYVHPDPSNTTYNGLWVLIDEGGVGSPWVLRRHPFFISDAQSFAGKLFVVANGSDEEGTAFVTDITIADPTTGMPMRRLAGQSIRRRVTTTDATPTTIATGKTTADDQLLLLHARVTAFDPATGDHARWVMDAVVRRVAGPTLSQKSKVFVNGPVKDAAFATTDVTLNFSGADAQIQVTGVAATTIKWFVELFESRYV